MSEQRTRGPGAAHERRRTEIADAVLAVVREGGVAAVSMSRVADAAGVSVGRVQHYFGTKHGLLAAGFERANALSTARIDAALGGDQRRAAPREVLAVVLTELIPHDPSTRTHLRVRQAFTALALVDEPIAERLRAEYARLHERLRALLLRAGAPDPEAAVELVALAEGLAYYVLTGVTDPATARARVLAALGRVSAPAG